jgi:hypothetical protein
MEMGSHFEPLVDLVGLQLTDGDTAYQLAERVLPQIQIDFRKPHEGQRSTGGSVTEFACAPKVCPPTVK